MGKLSRIATTTAALAGIAFSVGAGTAGAHAAASGLAPAHTHLSGGSLAFSARSRHGGMTARHRSTPRWRARSSSAMAVDDHASLRMRKAFGPVLIEEGLASGSLPGRTWARLVVKRSVSASFTIHAKGGEIKGTGQASLHSSGRYASFGGSLRVTGGSGRYAHAHGSGRLYGVIDRRTHAVTVKTVGTLHY